MFPMKIVLAGNDERTLPHVRRELSDHEIDLEAEFPTLEKLFGALRGMPEQLRMLLVHLKSPEDVRWLRQLTGTFVGKPVLVLMDVSDAKQVFEVMRAGATQIVPLPLQSHDFKAALDCIGLQFGYRTHSSRVIAVTGVTGGCGATTLALNLADEIAQFHDLSTILAELSLQIGMLETFLEVQPVFALDGLVNYGSHLDMDIVKKALTKVTDKFSILAGPKKTVTSNAHVCGQLLRIIEIVRLLVEAVVLDVPCNFDDSYFDILKCADRVVIVGEQRIPAIRNLQLVLDALGQESTTRKHVLVLNRYDPKMQGFTVEDLGKQLSLPRVATLVNDPQAVNAALSAGQTLRHQAPSSRIVADISALTRDMLGRNVEQPADKSTSDNVFRRFCHALGLS